MKEPRLFSPTYFRELVSGRRRGVGPSVLRGFLRAGEYFYAWAVRWRNRRYDRGLTPVFKADVPVVSVGNLTLGGTGKTPLVRWIAQWFADHGVRVAVVSRGYGAQKGRANDEALELQKSLPLVPHLQNPDRVAAVREAMTSLSIQAVVLDDAFQHRRMCRDLDIVLLDALEPFGFDHVFPRGTLREPIEGLQRAHTVILSRADCLDPADRKLVWQQVRHHAPEAVCAEVTHAPCRLFSAQGTNAPLDKLQGQSVAAFCGIGNPAGFRHTLEGCGCRVLGFRTFPDHYAYTSSDIEDLTAWAARLGASCMLCTGKDLVKMPVEQLGERKLWAVGIELEFLSGREALEAQLHQLLRKDEEPKP